MQLFLAAASHPIHDEYLLFWSAPGGVLREERIFTQGKGETSKKRKTTSAGMVRELKALKEIGWTVVERGASEISES